MHIGILSLNSRLGQATIAVELAGPHIVPLGIGVCIASRDLEVPNAIVSNKKASDMLEAVHFAQTVVLEYASLNQVVGQSVG